MKRRYLFGLLTGAITAASKADWIWGFDGKLHPPDMKWVPILRNIEFKYHDMTTAEGISGHMRDLVLYGQAKGVYPPKQPKTLENAPETALERAFLSPLSPPSRPSKTPLR